MKISPEDLKQLAIDYKKNEVPKREPFYQSTMIAFLILGCDELLHNHDEEDITVLAQYLLELDIGSERELKKKRWEEEQKRKMALRTAVPVTIKPSLEIQGIQRYWWQDI